MRQETLTIVAELHDVPRAKEALRKLASEHANGADKARAYQPRLFADLGVHFGRVVLIEEPVTSAFASWLVLESNFDTEQRSAREARREHLRQLVAARGPMLTELFSACVDFPAQHEPARLLGALCACLVEATAAYQGHMHRDLARIALEREVRVEAMRCAAQIAGPTSDAELLRTIRAHVADIARAEPERFRGLDLDAPPPPDPDPKTREQKLRQDLRPWFQHSLPALPLLGLAPFIAWYEATDTYWDLQREAESIGPDGLRLLDEDARTEDFATQNPLTHLVPLRDGIARGAISFFSHAYIRNMAARHFNFTEQLGGIPTIHFAKWLRIDGGRRLLFFSNYDGSWESYLGDFVDRAALGLNLAWCCTELYPKTRFLLTQGADDEERFKAWGRAYQRPTQLFYTAYPDLSVADVNNNTWLRWGLHRGAEVDVAAWRRRLT